MRTLSALAEDVRTLDVPVLLAWGPRDPVFSDLYLRDLVARLPHADVHRYEGASHLVTEDAPAAIDDIRAWVERLPAPRVRPARVGPAARGPTHTHPHTRGCRVAAAADGGSPRRARRRLRAAPTGPPWSSWAVRDPR